MRAWTEIRLGIGMKRFVTRIFFFGGVQVKNLSLSNSVV